MSRLIINLEFQPTTTDQEQFKDLRQWIIDTFREKADWNEAPANVVDKFTGVKVSFPYLQEAFKLEEE